MTPAEAIAKVRKHVEDMRPGCSFSPESEKQFNIWAEGVNTALVMIEVELDAEVAS